MKILSIPSAQNMNKKFEKFCPEHLGQIFSNFFVHILGNATTSYFRFEMYRPLESLSYTKILFLTLGTFANQNKGTNS